MRRLAVVGAGYSGTLLAINLLRLGGPDVVVSLIERAGRFGPGRAYATGHPGHLLNVPAGRMGAFPERPEGFLHWRRARPGQDATQPGDFVPRGEYGAYLEQLLADAATAYPGRLTLLPTEAVALDGEGAPVLRDGRVVPAEAVVLAVGNFAPLPPSGLDPAALPPSAYAADPWSPDALAGLDPGAPVLLVGTGLTMADLVTSLLDGGHRGPIHILSRRGLLPRPHAPMTAPALPSVGHPVRLLPLLRAVRQQVRDSAGPWQAVLDPLRPVLRTLWSGATPAERRQFLRHLRPWWDAHRHRLPPSTAGRLAAARCAGQLHAHAGRIVGAAPGPAGGALVTVRPRGATCPATLAVARVVNCTGPAADYGRIADPLLRFLLDTGAVRPDVHRLGLDVAEDFQLRRADGSVSGRLFAFGPVLRASLWEMTSVPDLRHEAPQLAARLLEPRSR